MKRLRELYGQLTFANIVSVVALFIALGGTSYAAMNLPANSVGTKQLKKGSVGTKHLKAKAVTSKKVKNGSLLIKDFKHGQIKSGPTGPTGQVGLPGAPGVKGPPGAGAEYLYGTVSSGAILPDQSLGVESVASVSISGYNYKVTFDRDITNCGLFGSIRFAPSPAHIQTGLNTSTTALVKTTDNANALITNANFVIGAMCPPG